MKNIISGLKSFYYSIKSDSLANYNKIKELEEKVDSKKLIILKQISDSCNLLQESILENTKCISNIQQRVELINKSNTSGQISKIHESLEEISRSNTANINELHGKLEIYSEIYDHTIELGKIIDEKVCSDSHNSSSIENQISQMKKRFPKLL